MKINHQVAIAFSVEGPWEEFKDIPRDALIAGLAKRLDEVRLDPTTEAFDDCDNSYEVED